MEFYCGLSLEFQRVVIIFNMLSWPLHPEICSKLLSYLSLMATMSKGDLSLLLYLKGDLPYCYTYSKTCPYCCVKEKTAEEKHMSFHIEVVLLENLDLSMILTDEDQPPYVEDLDSRTSLFN